MEIREIRNEQRRGCGFRKQGGLYMMAGRPNAPCGKLPLELTVCPVCGQGIKPARGWTWVNGRLLFADVKCNMEHDRGDGDMSLCAGCVLDHPPERMGLLWIGEKFYKTPDDFLKEGIQQGISRRITAIPKDFVVGETWVLFAHRKTISKIETCDNCKGTGLVQHPESNYRDIQCPECEGTAKIEKWVPGIFGCFLPERIEYIVKDDDDDEKLERLEKRGVKLVKLVWDDQAEGQKSLDMYDCERCGKPTGGDYYSAPDCNDTGVDVCLCEKCYEDLMADREEVARDRDLAQQELIDFAQDDYQHNIPGDEIL